MIILPKEFVESVDEFIESWQSKSFETIEDISAAIEGLYEETDRTIREYEVWEKNVDP